MYWYVNFPFLLLGYFPVQASFSMPSSHSQISFWQPKLKHWAAASASVPLPQPFPRQAGKEPEAPTQPTLPENQISDKKALSLGTIWKSACLDISDSSGAPALGHVVFVESQGVV